MDCQVTLHAPRNDRGKFRREATRLAQLLPTQAAGPIQFGATGLVKAVT